jgi:hypothetical protein
MERTLAENARITMAVEFWERLLESLHKLASKVNRAPGMDAVTATIICHVDDRVVVSLDNASKSSPRKRPERG